MTARALILLAAAGSAAILLGALGFQYLGGLAPCKLCIWQRWPHGLAIALGLLFLAFPRREIALLAGVIVLAGAGIGGYHAGVELAIFEGPDSCTSGPIGGVPTEDLFEQIMNAPVVRCDDIAWSFLGLSMAGWNMVISLGLGTLWLLGWRARA